MSNTSKAIELRQEVTRLLTELQSLGQPTPQNRARLDAIRRRMLEIETLVSKL